MLVLANGARRQCLFISVSVTVSVEESLPEAIDAHALFGAPPPTGPESNGRMESVAASTGSTAGATPVTSAAVVSSRSEADQLQAHVSHDHLCLRSS